MAQHLRQMRVESTEEAMDRNELADGDDGAHVLRSLSLVFDVVDQFFVYFRDHRDTFVDVTQKKEAVDETHGKQDAVGSATVQPSTSEEKVDDGTDHWQVENVSENVRRSSLSDEFVDQGEQACDSTETVSDSKNGTVLSMRKSHLKKEKKTTLSKDAEATKMKLFGSLSYSRALAFVSGTVSGSLTPSAGPARISSVDACANDSREIVRNKCS